MPAHHNDPGLENLLPDALQGLKKGDCLKKSLPPATGEEISDFPAMTPASQLLEKAVRALNQAMTAPNPTAELSADLQRYPALSLLYADLLKIRKFLLGLVQGDLSQEMRLKGYLAGALKALQANLRHLTWQTQMIAAGDFSQRVDFMGEFSQAFNAMVLQLEENQRQINEKQAVLTRLNEELRAEIELRKKTEASLRQSEDLYRQLAITDPLTGIFNRRHFFQLAMSELQRTCRYGHSLTVIIFDLDYFKLVNDNYGHDIGDQVLQSVANAVRASIRTMDIFARYGGEEFILLLPETGLEAGLALAERLRCRIAATPVPHQPDPIQITLSAGISVLTPSGQPHPMAPDTLGQLIKHADQALYEAKKSGRNRVQSLPLPTILDISIQLP
jgi:diguanylate cyclase (GGDEF)-like protein